MHFFVFTKRSSDFLETCRVLITVIPTIVLFLSLSLSPPPLSLSFIYFIIYLTIIFCVIFFSFVSFVLSIYFLFPKFIYLLTFCAPVCTLYFSLSLFFCSSSRRVVSHFISLYIFISHSLTHSVTLVIFLLVSFSLLQIFLSCFLSFTYEKFCVNCPKVFLKVSNLSTL